MGLSFSGAYLKGSLRSHGDVATVDDFGPAVEGVCFHRDVVAAAGS